MWDRVYMWFIRYIQGISRLLRFGGKNLCGVHSMHTGVWSGLGKGLGVRGFWGLQGLEVKGCNFGLTGLGVSKV